MNEKFHVYFYRVKAGRALGHTSKNVNLKDDKPSEISLFHLETNSFKSSK